jgi:hypothetical protein
MDLKVFITTNETVCSECAEDLGRHAWITLAGEKGALCLTCADLDHLAFLPAGDAALTRRSVKHSTLSAVVLQWSRARKHYERQGVLVEETALQQAEQECLADADARARRKDREAERRAELDHEYIQRFALRVRELFPSCPAGREQVIAEHACQKYSGRVGRSASAKALDEQAIQLAVIAHVRHAETRYDEFLAEGLDRFLARAEIADGLNETLNAWSR